MNSNLKVFCTLCPDILICFLIKGTKDDLVLAAVSVPPLLCLHQTDHFVQ